MHEGLIGRVIAGQRIEGVAGRGGMGVVYRATDVELERRVAVKVIAPAHADDPAFRRRFIAESRTAASLDHPNVITIHRAGEEDGILYQVMRFVEGEDLRGVLSREGPLEPERVVRILTQVASALDAAHASGLVHRDVKPANILLGAGDHVYLTDFGLSKRTAGTDETRTAGVMGTVNYLAPEQIRGQPLDARTDVYALGAVLFQMLTARVPFPGDSDEATMWAHLSAPPPRPSALRPDLPSGLDGVIRRAMSKHRDERHPTAGELAAVARAILREEPRRGDAALDLAALSDDIRALVDRAHKARDRIHDAIRRAGLPYAEVAGEVDRLVEAMEQTALRAQLLRDGLDDAPPAEVARRLEELRTRPHRSRRELEAALEKQLFVQRRLEHQLGRFHAHMDRMLVELDTVRGSLISASVSAGAYPEQRVAGGIRELRDEVGAVAEGLAAAYEVAVLERAADG